MSNFTIDTPSFSGSPLPAKVTMFGASVQPRRPCAPGGLAPKAAAGQIAGTMPPLSQPERPISPGLTDYDTALAAMEARAAAIHAGATGDPICLPDHPPLFPPGQSEDGRGG